MIIEGSRVVRKYKAGYEIKEEFWKTDPNDPGIRRRQAYTPSGDYIGETKWAYRLCVKRGIKPEKAKPEHSVCSIGFCEREQKWYGWSHRAIFGFGIGSTCSKGDCHYRPATPQELFEDITTPDTDGWAWHKPEEVEITESGVRIKMNMVKAVGVNPDGSLICENVEPDYMEIECGRGEWTATTLEEAKQMAIDFAESVS